VLRDEPDKRIRAPRNRRPPIKRALQQREHNINKDVAHRIEIGIRLAPTLPVALDGQRFVLARAVLRSEAG